jgi:hypothetical protein
MTELAQDRLVRKEVALGAIREYPVDERHIWSSIAPFQSVQSDDVIFQYITPEVGGLAPARAEDAESELARKDDTIGYGRASIVDWAEKDHYSASDVTRFREYQRLAEIAGGDDFPLTVGSMTEDWQAKLARDSRRRRRKLDNRLEWLTISALVDGVIAYDDGKVRFSVDYGRPAGQQSQAPASTIDWDLGAAHDPIGDLIAVTEYMRDTYDIEMGTVLLSPKAIRYIINSDKFAARAGVGTLTTSTTYPEPRYVIDGWNYEAAAAVVSAATGLRLQAYDSKYRTRTLGSTTTTNNRFMPENEAVFLPAAGEIDLISDSEIGFAKTLTSPHPEGGFAPGFYEWEQGTKDPWGQDVGSGIKAFPVFPHLEWTYNLTLWT